MCIYIFYLFVVLLRAIPRKRGRPKRDGKADVPQIKLIDKLIEATRTGASQPAVYASTTKGGMKLVYEGHHFKFSFRKGQFSVFQCCYKENREECKVRVVCDQKRVYPLDGEHVHFVQATDKSVTSEQFTPGDNDNEVIIGDETASTKAGGETLFILEDANTTEHVIVAESIAKEEPDFDEGNEGTTGLESLHDTTDCAGGSSGIADANDFREKIKRRLQKALQNKKK